jgi:hypothetical protein
MAQQTRSIRSGGVIASIHPSLFSDKGDSLFALKQRFVEETFKERLDRSDARWRKKLDQLRAAA